MKSNFARSDILTAPRNVQSRRPWRVSLCVMMSLCFSDIAQSKDNKDNSDNDDGSTKTASTLPNIYLGLKCFLPYPEFALLLLPANMGNGVTAGEDGSCRPS